MGTRQRLSLHPAKTHVAAAARTRPLVDRIVSLAGRAVDTWDLSVDLPIVVRDRAGRERALQSVPHAQNGFAIGDIGVGPVMQPQVRDVAPDDPADLGGIEAGDVIVAIDGEPVSGEDLIARIGSSASGTPLLLTVRRNGRTEQVQVTPVEREDRAVIGVGLSPSEMRVVEPDLFEAFRMSLARNYEWSGLIFETLGGFSPRRRRPVSSSVPSASRSCLGQRPPPGGCNSSP